MPNYSFAEVQHRIDIKEVNCYQLVESAIHKIEANKHLNAFLEVFEEDALKRALEIDDKIKAGAAGKLAGIIIGIKDNICYQGHKVGASSKILNGFESLFSSTAVERLLAEDAIIIGRLNCDEFAMGSSNENSAFGPVLNPIDIERVPGGSSGGSAAAVAAGLCDASLGSDTGGSIRQPASFCGIVGLKPTYGRISRWGLIAYSSSLDQIGPFTNSVEDSATLLEIMAGKDAYDTTASQVPVDDYSNFERKESPKRIAFIKEVMEAKGLSGSVKKAYTNQLEALKNQGHTIEEVSFPFLDIMVPTYYVISNAEASSNLSRYDGMRYGYRSDQAEGVESTYVTSRSEGFGPEVKRRIMLGTFVLSAGYYDAYFAQAQRVRQLLKTKTEEILNSYDFIVTPTTPHEAFKLNAKNEDPVSMYLEDIFTVQANLTGNPAISIPQFSVENGLPVGFQILAKHFHEKEMLSFAHTLMNN